MSALREFEAAAWQMSLTKATNGLSVAQADEPTYLDALAAPSFSIAETRMCHWSSWRGVV
ncbi:hypothetical protein BQ8482_440014 [Mesorhizobium delmotii]|uniref:Uncharacterized protein n=1 Tax=Mesorhizobium delmotii TaxID=1631247 RepID=A0A2P9ATM2_9HYPH|nr:hypothetical protein BQ8482_440014 [Mesorhizobium delmotii]